MAVVSFNSKIKILKPVFRYIPDIEQTFFDNFVGRFRRFRWSRQMLQTVLCCNSRNMRDQFTQHIRPELDPRIILVAPGQCTQRLGIPRFGFYKLFTVEVNIAQRRLSQRFFNTVPNAFFFRKQVVFNGLLDIILRQVSVTDSCMDLIEILLVFLVVCHLLQLTDNLSSTCSYLRLSHQHIERLFVGRTQSFYLSKCFIRIFTLTQISIYLPEQKLQPSFPYLAFFIPDGLY
ncbi:hypothetical protein SDC9_99057 [bioreactor metagenome]|uniref:Uncharacterized protein n=1 Tax=bioreactor metagenome TaxID=1076179 RepID=A0A645AHW2_9ZZZZ